MSVYQQGQKATIYRDPITEQNPEGLAVLLNITRSDETVETWDVSFLGEDRIVVRRIKIVGKNNPDPTTRGVIHIRMSGGTIERVESNDPHLQGLFVIFTETDLPGDPDEEVYLDTEEKRFIYTSDTVDYVDAEIIRDVANKESLRKGI